jgi:hypothetical protein
MNRSDLRLLGAIVATAALSATITRLATTPCSTTLERRVDQLEARITTLEVHSHPASVPPVPPVPPVAPVPPVPPVPPVATATDCDEVSCVLNNYEPACCAPFRKAAKAAPTALPDSLDREAITSVMQLVRDDIAACGKTDPAKGVLKISIKVAPSGDVASATVRTTPSESLGRCVIGVMSRAHFAQTLNGGSFSYPLVF